MEKQLWNMYRIPQVIYNNDSARSLSFFKVFDLVLLYILIKKKKKINKQTKKKTITPHNKWIKSWEITKCNGEEEFIKIFQLT